MQIGESERLKRTSRTIAIAFAALVPAALLTVVGNSAIVRTQESVKSLLLAKDSVSLAEIKKSKKILHYDMTLLGERLYRDTYFDTADHYLYRHGMIYRIRESYDGQVWIEFHEPVATGNDFIHRIHSVPVPLDRVDHAKQGEFVDSGLNIKLTETIGEREFKSAQLFIESHRYRILLSQGGNPHFLIALTAGKFAGLSGKRFVKPFWSVEVEFLAQRATAAHVDELKQLVQWLTSRFKLLDSKKPLYGVGLDRTVLLRSSERMLQPVRVLGGAKGKSLEHFDMADALAFTHDGKLVAGDINNARFKIYVLGENFQSVQGVGGKGSKAGEFGHAFVTTLPNGRDIHDGVQGIAINKQGLIYVIDQANLRIQVFDASGRVFPDKAIALRYCPKREPMCHGGLVYPSRKGEYRSIQGLAIDQEGALYVSDKGTNRIYKVLADGRFDPGFKFQGAQPMTGKPILAEPESLALHGENLFVADERNGEIKIFNRRSGAFVGAFGMAVFGGHVEGVAVSADYLFAVDSNQNRIVVFHITGQSPRFLLAFVGDFESADGIAVDPTGRFLAIADQGNHRILLYSLPEIQKELAAR